jgi:Flp pilus assembly protein TadD
MVSGPVSERARLLLAAGRPRDALTLLAPHLAEHPDDQRALSFAGWSHLQLGSLNGALDMAHRLAVNAPESADTHLLLGAVHTRRREFALAAQSARTAMRLAPHNPTAYLLAADIDMQAGTVTDLTVQSARRAVELDPDSADTHSTLGAALLTLKRRREAAEHLKKARSLDPSSSNAANEMGRWHLRYGAAAQAAQEFAAAAIANPADPVPVQNIRAAAWRAFATAQIVLWASFYIMWRIVGNQEPLRSPARFFASAVVAVTLAAWCAQLWRSWRGTLMLAKSVRGDRLLQIGVPAHAACLALLVASAFAAQSAEKPLLAIGAMALATASITTWIHRHRLRKQSRPSQ